MWGWRGYWQTDGQAGRQMNIRTVWSSSEPRLKIAVGAPLSSLQRIVTSPGAFPSATRIAVNTFKWIFGRYQQSQALDEIKTSRTWGLLLLSCGTARDAEGKHSSPWYTAATPRDFSAWPQGESGCCPIHSCPPVGDILVFLPCWSWRWNVLTRCFALMLLANMWGTQIVCLWHKQTNPAVPHQCLEMDLPKWYSFRQR